MEAVDEQSEWMGNFQLARARFPCLAYFPERCRAWALDHCAAGRSANARRPEEESCFGGRICFYSLVILRSASAQLPGLNRCMALSLRHPRWNEHARASYK